MKVNSIFHLLYFDTNCNIGLRLSRNRMNYTGLNKYFFSPEETTTVDQNNSNVVISPEDESKEAIVTEINETVMENSESNDIPQSLDSRTSSCASTDKQGCDTETEQVGTDMEIDEHPPDLTDGVKGKPTYTLPDIETGLVVTDENVSLEEKRAKHYIAENQSLSIDKMLQDKTFRIVDKESTGSLSEANQDGLTPEDETQRVTTEDEKMKNDNVTNITQSSTNIGAQIDSQPKSGNVQIHVDNVDDFNSFNYWRTPIPLIDIDLSIVDSEESILELNTGIGTEEKSYACQNLNDADGEIHDLSEALSESLPDLSVCDKDTSVIEGQGAGRMLDQASGQVNSLNSDKPCFEKANFMGNESETTIPVIDGVLQGKFQSSVNFSYCACACGNFSCRVKYYPEFGCLNSNRFIVIFPITFCRPNLSK